jgi:uncharacterized damage-inducible protein DinB
MTSDPRYPIGKFNSPGTISESDRETFIDEIESAPAQLRASIAGLSTAQLSTRYREGGWTVKQLVHHVPDSHMNAYIRFKLALTEEEPTIKPYEEARWAELPDSDTVPVETSLALLDSLHKRWVPLLRSIPAANWSRKFRHPERGTMTLDQNLALYAWHGKHHVAHITSLRERNNWK